MQKKAKTDASKNGFLKTLAELPHGGQRILDSNRLCFIFSLILAVIIWAIVSVYASPTVTRTVKSVPVSIDMSDDSNPVKLGLTIFGQTEFTVDVTVSGKKYLVSESALKAEDLIVTASTSYVSESGKNTLRLKAAAVSGGNDVTITSLSTDSIQVYFDYLRTSQQTVEADVRYSVSQEPDDGLVVGAPILSQNTVTISGPATGIRKVSRVVARVNLESPPSETSVYDAQITALDAYGDEVEYVSADVDSFTLTIPVKRVVDARVVVNFTNVPNAFVSDGLPEYVASPAKISVEVPVGEADENEFDVNVGTIDFDQLSNAVNEFVFDTDDLDYETHGDVNEINVTVDLSNLDNLVISDITVDDVRIVNAPADKSFTVTALDYSSIDMIGPSDSLARLTKESLMIELDPGNSDLKNGVNTVPVRISSLADDCWAYGTYSVTLLVQ